MRPDHIDFLIEVAKRANSAAYSVDCGIVILESNVLGTDESYMLIGIYSTDDVDADEPISASDCISTAKLKIHGEYAGQTMLSLTFVEDGAVERIFNASGDNLVSMFYM